MDENPIQVSAERKIEILQRLHLIGSMTEEYCTNKKMLASLVYALEKESKTLAATKYPLIGDDIDELNYLLAQLTAIIGHFRKAKKAEHFRITSTELGAFFVHIDRVIVETAMRLSEKSDTRKRMGAALKKACTFSEQLEAKTEGGSEPPKKAIRDRDSE